MSTHTGSKFKSPFLKGVFGILFFYPLLAFTEQSAVQYDGETELEKHAKTTSKNLLNSPKIRTYPVKQKTLMEK